MFRLITVLPHLLYRRPVIMFLIQVIPTHFIHADGEDRFKVRIDTLFDQTRQHHLIDKKNGRMTEIKQQNMSQWVTTVIKYLI
ncbi:hypothetical protein SDC9_39164 [bioreactor metagenome]|uniref:Uncharacterized protein n=1 Tax=bioreactor metagenome TaxID=1076179 RepID=A0A644VPB0_9ZZZZ